MKTGLRLGLYAAGLAAAFAGAYGIAGAVVPESAVAAWAQQNAAQESTMNDHAAHGDASAPGDAGGHGGHDLQGVSLSAGGYALSPVHAPGVAGEQGTLSFRILDAAGEPLTEYAPQHEKELHLVVVRADGMLFAHVHPRLDPGTGTWSIPWIWSAGGTYRVYADFAAAAEGASPVTLSTTVQVAGDYDPVASTPSRVAQVDGYTVELGGDLVAGASSELGVSVTRDGVPVTTLEPYLGAFGHLVALREGDLAYLHVHAEGAAPTPGSTAGPDIAFAAQAPTAGRYLLYLDFQVEGRVHTAAFVVDAVSNGTLGTGATGGQGDQHGSGDSGSGHSHG